MLNEIYKKDKYWRTIAFAICKDKDLADDLVQDMYLKIFDITKSIDDYYIISIIRNLFLDLCRKKNEDISIDLIYNLAENNNSYEFDDNDLKILNKADKLKWWQKKLLEENFDKSLRQIETEFNINYGFIYRELEKARRIILKDNYKKKYKNKRFKNYSPKK